MLKPLEGADCPAPNASAANTLGPFEQHTSHPESVASRITVYSDQTKKNPLSPLGGDNGCCDFLCRLL